MKIGLIAMSGVRVRTKELAELGVSLPQFVNRGKVSRFPSQPGSFDCGRPHPQRY